MSSLSAVQQGITAHFQHQPTAGQAKLIKQLSEFLAAKAERVLFVIKGYAGTGKTTLVSALVKSLPALGLKNVLMAPTGRAAKVLANYSGVAASTIHRKIYKQKRNAFGSTSFVLQKNNATNTIFIVDEASMIGDETSDFSKSSLLNDLITYVYGGKGCKLILIGDTAQLPPVGVGESPALNEEYLKTSFDLEISSNELTEVVRQQQYSGILENATGVRELIASGEETFPQFITKGYKDMYRMTGERLEDGLNYAYSKFGIEDSMVVCRTNKQANQYNQHIRNRILSREEELSSGDYLMVVRNNYFWLPEESAAGFIANGDIVEIVRIRGHEILYGFRFAKVVVRLIDYPLEPTFDAIIMMDTIMMETPALPYADSSKLFDTVMDDYADEASRAKRVEKVKNNPYFNALQVKFAYAVTCHKAQGGQWKSVFVDQGYLTDEMVNTEYLRWLYTAITRATAELFLVNFNDKFFVE